MWLISTEAHFSAAHQLREYPGECERQHGHNFKVRVAVRASELGNLGFAMDFKELKAMLKEGVKKFDHRNLNELPEFKNVNPSAENIAKLLYNDLKAKLESYSSKAEIPVTLKLKEVQVWESDTNSATYCEE
jgi:6-pyruvoyltetrahydropterin/6-carboxytetrahydropterin synthase